MAAGFPEHLMKYYKDPRLHLLNLPEKATKNIFKYLNPVDCFNFSLCSKRTRDLVKETSNYTISQIFLRFDDERSCVGVYFHQCGGVACVFYSWKKVDGHRRCWNSAYKLNLSKFISYIFTNRYHPREVRNFQKAPIGASINYIQGALDIYKELVYLYPVNAAYVSVGVNVTNKKTCHLLSVARFPPMTIHCLRMLAKREAQEVRVKEALRAVRNVNVPSTVYVSFRVGEACMSWELINTPHVVLDDPEWLTRIHLLSFNCISVDIGLNWLSPEDLNAFLFQWYYADDTRLQRLEINLSPEAFDNKKRILDGLPLIPWDPKRREGEHFDVDQYLRKSTLRDPNHWLDCKHAKDLVKADGRLATILFYARKLYFIVWTNPFPYRTLKEARKKKRDELARKELIKRLKTELKRVKKKAEEDWIRRAEQVAVAVIARQNAAAAAREERVAKRKYFEALQEFMDTSEPEPKRRLLRTITIFKEGEDFDL